MSSGGGVVRTASMQGDASKVLTTATALAADNIQSFTGDGFTVGTAAMVNTNGTTYHWVAFSAGDNIDVGSYVGNGTSLTVHGVGFQSEVSVLMGSSTQMAQARTSQSTNTFDWLNNTGVSTGITSYTSDGFALGASTAANNSGTTFHYLTFNESGNYLKTGSYTGTGVDNRNITGMGFEPEFVLIRNTSVADFFQAKTESTGASTDILVTGSTNSIQALQSDGFQVGTATAVNTSGNNYMYFGWGQKAAPIFVDTTSDTSDGTTTSLTALRAAKGTDGLISLREAIAAANNSRNGANIDNIEFVLAGTGAQTITLGSVLAVTDGISIDGTTQAGWVQGSFLPIVLDGNNLADNAIDLSSGATGSTIRGLVVRDFAADAIDVASGSTTIAGNWIGQFNSDGSDAGSGEANSGAGVRVVSASAVTIGGSTAADRNVIAGNDTGVTARGTTSGLVISGNYFGTSITGNALRGAMNYGVYFMESASSSTIGGTTTSARNVIAGTTIDGIRFISETNDNNVIRNNYIGLAANGSTVLGVGGDGIMITGGGDNTVIGGVAMGNVIVGARGNGIEIDGASTGTSILGNFVGVDGSLTIVTGTGQSGIILRNSAANSTIGGVLTGKRTQSLAADDSQRRLTPGLTCRARREPALRLPATRSMTTTVLESI